MFGARKFYIYPRNMGPMDLQLLKANIRNNGGTVCSAPDPEIQIIIARKSCAVSEVRGIAGKCPCACAVGSEWLTECIRQSKVIETRDFQLFAHASETNTHSDVGNNQQISQPSEQQILKKAESCPANSMPANPPKRTRTEPPKNEASPDTDTQRHPRAPPSAAGHDLSLDLANPSSDWAAVEDLPLPAVPSYRPAAVRPPPRRTPDWQSALLHMVPPAPNVSSAA